MLFESGDVYDLIVCVVWRIFIFLACKLYFVLEEKMMTYDISVVCLLLKCEVHFAWGGSEQGRNCEKIHLLQIIAIQYNVLFSFCQCSLWSQHSMVHSILLCIWQMC
jgi:hypothetical protein